MLQMAHNSHTNTRSLREIAQPLLTEIARERARGETVVPSEALLSVLHIVFPQTLQPALDLVDRNCITKVVSPSGRELFQVKGSSGKIYFCLMSSEFCTCPSYTYYVLMKEEILMCKHVLAVYIAQNLETLNERKVSDKHLTEILTSTDEGWS